MEDTFEPTEVLLQFKAGRMNMLGTTVRPDPRKGLFRIVRGDDLLVHAQWMERGGVDGNQPGRVEEDVIVFPEEAVFKKVGQASGRVFLLSFSADERKFFYWMQESDISKDESLCAEVNVLLNEEMPDEEDEQGRMGMPGADVGEAGEAYLDEEEEEEDGGGDEDMGASDTKDALLSAAAQLEATAAAQGSRGGVGGLGNPIGSGGLLWGQAVGAAGAGQAGSGTQAMAAQAAAALAASLQMGQFQNLVSGLSAIQVPPELLAASRAKGAGAAAMLGLKEPSLTELLSPQLLVPALDDPQVLSRLQPHLPPALQSKSQVQQLVQSPQFQQQLDTLSLLLRSGRIDLAQFDIDVNKYGYGVTSFLRAIQEQTPINPDAKLSEEQVETTEPKGDPAESDQGNETSSDAKEKESS